MSEEFNLSDEIIQTYSQGYNRNHIHKDDVKEFIKRLKDKIRLEMFHNDGEVILKTDVLYWMDKLAGEKLI